MPDLAPLSMVKEVVELSGRGDYLIYAFESDSEAERE